MRRSGKLKVEYAQPFVESARRALDKVAGGPTTSGPINLAGTTYRGAPVNVAARVTGSLTGELVCSMSSLTARQLAEKLTGEDVEGFGPVLRAGLVGLASIWRKQAAVLLQELGYTCEIGEPFVFQGLNVKLATTQPALTAPIETPVGRVDISVAVSDG